jgi:hypothetical protein
MFIGAAMHHLNRPKNSFYQSANDELSSKMVFSAGVRLTIDDQSYFTFMGDYSRQGTAREIIGGGMYSYKVGELADDPRYIVNFGAYMRWQDAIIPVVQLDMMPLSIALSYDVNISQLETVSQGRGGVEISVSYIGFLNRDNSSKYKMLCPKF